MSAYKPGSAEFGSIGAKYGAKTHTLTVAESSPHTHQGLPDGNGNYPSALVTNVYDKPQFGYYSGTAYSGTGGLFNIWGSLSSSGGGGAHNNVQPTVAALLVIKT